jgi:hypothetical protein
VRVRPPGDASAYVFWIGDGEQVEGTELSTTIQGPVRVRFSHDEYGEGELVIDGDEAGPEAFPVPRRLELAGDGVVEVYDPEEGYWAPAAWRHQPGARVRIKREGHATNYRVLEGPGPYVLYPGDATIELALGDLDGAVCWVDGEGFRADRRVGGPGALVIRGLDAGPHTLLVGAPGRRPKAIRVVLAPAETRRITVALKRR